MKPAELSRQGQTLYSHEFADIYFSPEAGIAESEYVFLQANQLPERWQQQPQVTCCELGFGSGLNMLLTWQNFQQHAPKNTSLHYIAIEKYPLDVAQLRALHAQFPTLATYSNALCQHYPPQLPGFYCQPLADNVTLTLIFDDVKTALPQITDSVDIWYLDGFAPQKNPDMWQPPIFTRMAELSHAGTTLSTFTAAGDVRRGLSAAGFAMRKQPGFGQKRDMLLGHYTPQQKPRTTGIKPWFARPDLTLPQGASVAVIGAGLAGCACAHTLSHAGYSVQLFDKHTDIAAGASGNPLGILKPYLTLDHSSLGQFYTLGFWHTQQMVKSLEQQGFELDILACGAIENHVEQWLEKLKHRQLPPECAQILTAQQCRSISQVNTTQPGLYLPTAMELNPTKLCQALLDTAAQPIIHQPQGIQTLTDYDSHWQLLSATGQSFTADAVIFCPGHDMQQWPQTADYPVTPCPGQLTFMPPQSTLDNLGCILSGPAYCLPLPHDQHIIGSTYRQQHNTRVTAHDHQQNLANLNTMVPDFNFTDALDTLDGRVSIRANTADHLPLVGPITDLKIIKTDYAQYAHGGTLTRSKYPAARYQRHLYLCAGFGSRGLSSCLLSARLITALLCQQALPLPKSLYEAIHPSRFWVRNLSR